MPAIIPKTLEDIAAIPGEVLTCSEVAPILGADPMTIHAQAMEQPERLGFPVIIMKSRVKIPKRPFIRLMTEGIREE